MGLDMDLDAAYQRTVEKIQSELIWQNLLCHYDNWYAFEMPDHWVITREFFQEIEDWMLENFGEPGTRYVMHPDPNTFDYLFRDESDLAWMVMKWG